MNENTYDISSIKRVTKKFLEVSPSTDPFSAATKAQVLGILFKICHHIRTGSLPKGGGGRVMKRIRRLSYFLHLYPQAANFPCECDVKAKKLE